MNKESLIQLGLTEEQADKVMESLNGSFVPKTRFNEVNTELQTAKNTIKERDGQLETLRKSTGDVEALRNQITQLQADNAQKDKDHAAEIVKMQREAVDNELLTSSKAKNAKAVAALFDPIDDKVDIDTYRTMREKQINALSGAEATSFLFGADATPNTPAVAGASPAGSVTTNPDPKVSGYETRLADARKSGNPALVVAIKREAAAEGITLF